MRVAILVNELNVRGGTHKQVHRLVDYLLRKGHTVKIITKVFDPLKCYPGVENFNVVSFESYFNLKNRNIVSKVIRKLIGSYKISKESLLDTDVINIHDNGFGLVNLMLKFLNHKKPIIWQINDLPPIYKLGASVHGSNHWSFPILRYIFRYIARINEEIVVNVSKNAERVKLHLGRDAHIFHCGVDLRNDTYREKKTTDGNRINIISTGVVLPYRNYETVLDVHKILKSKGFAVETKIIGSTSFDFCYSAKILDLIRKQKLECELLGDVTEEVLLDEYQKADVFLFLNIDQSWGLAVFEAMNLCVPAIVSNSVGATELLVNGQTAIIVDPLDGLQISEKIISLTRNELIRNQVTSDGFIATRQMTWDNMYSCKLESLLLKHA